MFYHITSFVANVKLNSRTSNMNKDSQTSQTWTRVKSGQFGWSAKFGQRPCLFHILIIGIKIKLNLQTMKILMRWFISHMELSQLDFHCLQMYVQIYLMSEVTQLYPSCQS